MDRPPAPRGASAHGLEGGETGADDELAEEIVALDRRAYHGRGGCSAAAPGPGSTDPKARRLVGRRPAVPSPGVRAHPSRARAVDQGGRHDLPLRHRRDRGGARAGARPRRASCDVGISGARDRQPQRVLPGRVSIDTMNIHVAPLLARRRSRGCFDEQGGRADRGRARCASSRETASSHLTFTRAPDSRLRYPACPRRRADCADARHRDRRRAVGRRGQGQDRRPARPALRPRLPLPGRAERRPHDRRRRRDVQDPPDPVRGSCPARSACSAPAA